MKQIPQTSIAFTLLSSAVLLFITSACNSPKPDPEPQPDPIEEPVEDMTEDSVIHPCEVDTAEDGCLSLEQYNEKKTRLIEQYENDPVYSNHWYGEKSGLSAAWSNIRLIHGASARPGAGVKIGMIDDGIDLTHPGLADASVTEHFFGGATKESSTTYTDEIFFQSFSHGTSVAGSILANGHVADHFLNFYGNANTAHLHLFTVQQTNGNPKFHNHIAEIMDIAREENIRILNISISSGDRIDEHESLDTVPIHQTKIDSYKQTGHDDKIIIVTATGNDSYPQPTSSAALPVFVPELKGHYIATAATHEDGSIGELSNHCGQAAEWCIAAPTSGIPILYSGLEDGEFVQSIYISHGTSTSTAYISGSLALVQQMFRDQLSSQELVERLFATADKTGLFSDSTIYGQGLVDLDAATSPVGELRVVFDDDDSAAMADTQVNLSPAFGDSLSQGLAGQEIATFDNLNAPFFLSLSNLYRTRTLSTPAALYRPGFTDPEASMQFMDNGLGGHSNHLSLARNVIAANVSHNRFSLRTYASLTQPNEPSIAGADLAWKTPFIPLSLRIGSLFEQGSVLGTRPYGAWGDVNTAINYLSLTGHVIRHGWLLNADLQLGYAVPSLHSAGMIDHISPLVTSTFDISATRKLAGKHHIRLSVSQPLRIEAGNATLIVPTGRLKSGSVTMNQLTTDLTPTGRQLDLTARLRGTFRLFDYDLATAYSLNPIHRATAPNELRVQFSLQASY